MDRRICKALWAYNGAKYWVMRQLCRTLSSPPQQGIDFPNLCCDKQAIDFFVGPTHMRDQAQRLASNAAVRCDGPANFWHSLLMCMWH